MACVESTVLPLFVLPNANCRAGQNWVSGDRKSVRGCLVCIAGAVASSLASLLLHAASVVIATTAVWVPIVHDALCGLLI